MLMVMNITRDSNWSEAVVFLLLDSFIASLRSIFCLLPMSALYYWKWRKKIMGTQGCIGWHFLRMKTKSENWRWSLLWNTKDIQVSTRSKPNEMSASILAIDSALFCAVLCPPSCLAHLPLPPSLQRQLLLTDTVSGHGAELIIHDWHVNPGTIVRWAFLRSWASNFKPVKIRDSQLFGMRIRSSVDLMLK